MLEILLQLLFFAGFILVVWHIHGTAMNDRLWRALLLEYKTLETPKTLQGTYLNIIYCYLGDRYMKRLYKFYETPDGLMITTSLWGFNRQSVQIPWEAIEPTEIHTRPMGTMRGLKIAQVDVDQINISRADYNQYIKRHIDV